MVAFHKEYRVSLMITGKNVFRNKIPEARKPGCLCNGIKTPDHDYQLHLGGTAKPSAKAPAGKVNRKNGKDATVDISDKKNADAPSLYITQVAAKS